MGFRPTLAMLPQILTRCFFIVFSLLCLSCCQGDNAKPQWHQLTNGLAYKQFAALDLPLTGRIYTFRINPKRYRFYIVALSGQHWIANTTATALQEKNGVIAINGGFFDRSLQPLGLRISQGKTYNAIKQVSWWGIFYLTKQGRAKIVRTQQFKWRSTIDFAIQAGPRLLINRHIPPLKTHIAERTAICITANQQIILAVTDAYPISLRQLAEFLRQRVGCVDALNLDGGHSSQMTAKVGNFRATVAGVARLADAIVVAKRHDR